MAVTAATTKTHNESTSNDDSQSDAIPTHPLGVKPLGNQYFATGPNGRKSIGNWRPLPDEILMVIFEYFDKPTLKKLGDTCKFFFAFCHSEELWKALFLQNEPSTTSVQWAGSWRSTVLGLPENSEAKVDCSNVFSDVLHRPFACSNINLSHYTSDIPKANLIRRFSNLSYEEFAEKWTEEPFVLTDCIQPWPAMSEWSIEYLLEKYGDVAFRAEAVDWTFSTYHKYMAKNRDESPLYLFDRAFAEKMGIKIGHDPEAAYWRPDCFGPDFFELLGEERPAHRWLIVGPERSGSTFHKDPNATSAWNAVIQGSKYWIMFPPTAQVPGVYVSRDSSEVTSPLSIAEWLLTFHEEARQLPDCVEGICSAGEILHVPSGWWHLVVNIESGIALTQNFVPKSPSLHNLSEALSFLRDKADQVSGFRHDIEKPSELFIDRLEAAHPDIFERALELADKKLGKKRKWDTAIGSAEEQAGGSFSFGFSVDEDDEDMS